MDYGKRVYDPRIGRFLSPDPLSAQYPELTPFQYASNRPIDGIDRDGLEFEKYAIRFSLKLATRTKTGREVLQGMGERANETVVQPIKNFFENNCCELGIPDLGLRTTIADPMQGRQIYERAIAGARLLGESIVQTISEYKELIKAASKGDNKAIGALGFEVAMFFVPGPDEILRALKPISRLPKTRGSWTAEVGNSGWISDIPEVKTITGGKSIPFVNGKIDLSNWSKVEFEIRGLTGTKSDFKLVYEKMVSEMGFESSAAAQKFLRDNNLSPHHAGGNLIQIVPTDLNKIPHAGGASELRNKKSN